MRVAKGLNFGNVIPTLVCRLFMRPPDASVPSRGFPYIHTVYMRAKKQKVCQRRRSRSRRRFKYKAAFNDKKCCQDSCYLYGLAQRIRYQNVALRRI
jgi:hypothetical protein